MNLKKLLTLHTTDSWMTCHSDLSILAVICSLHVAFGIGTAENVQVCKLIKVFHATATSMHAVIVSGEIQAAIPLWNGQLTSQSE